MTRVLAPRLIAGGLVAAAIGVAAVAAPAIWGLPRVLAWRWRDRFDDLRFRCIATIPGPDGPLPAEYAALRLLALERMGDAEPDTRAEGCFALLEL
ncbi:MAG TPA: hypothetical protein VHF22_07290, partial [Planctomycetota bacterium]|nr:hypothetical protein [Planctomycetota bacterium]